MNGISSTLKDEIKKSCDRKHKEKFKLAAVIIVTNIMVALLCLPMGETKVVNATSHKTIHPNHQMMALPLTALITETNQAAIETAVTLLSKDKKVIAEKAWLHEAMKPENGVTQFKIEINNSDIVRVSEFIESGVVAVPYVEIKKMKTTHKQGSKYEVSL